MTKEFDIPVQLTDLSHLEDYLNENKPKTVNDEHDQDELKTRSLFLSVLPHFLKALLFQPYEVTSILIQLTNKTATGYKNEEIAKPSIPTDDESNTSYDFDDTEPYGNNGRKMHAMGEYFMYKNKTVHEQSKTTSSIDSFGYIKEDELSLEQKRMLIPIDADASLFSNAGHIQKYLGTTGFYRGYLATAFSSIGSFYLTPLLQQRLSVLLPVPLSIIASNLFVDMTFHPLHLIKLRLIAQPIIRRHRTFSGYLQGFYSILKKDGVFGFFPHFWFTVSFYLSSSAIRIGLDVLFDSYFPEASVWVRYFSMVSFHLLHYPLLTIFRRLMVSPSTAVCVPTSTKPYTSALNALTRIVQEEGTSSLFRCSYYSVAFVSFKFLLERLVIVKE